jgi:energy-coupling factor transporter ATP-binding protein EcfA2
MKLESITLKDFQCFGNETTTIKLGDLTTLIGANGAGKSAVLLALARIFSTTPGLRGLRRADFHMPPLKKGEAPPKTIALTIDVRFSFPELTPEQPENPAVPPCFRHMAIDREDAPPFCRIRLEGTWHATNLADGEVEEHVWWVRSDEPEPKVDHKTAFSPRDRAIVHVIYVPAARDPAQEIRAASASLIGRLLNGIKWTPELRTLLTDGSENLDAVITGTDAIGTIQTSLEKRWQSLHNEALYANPSLRFTVGELEDFLRRVQVVFGPTPGDSHDSLNRLSDGMKSLFYFALVAAVFDVEQEVATSNLAKDDGAAEQFDAERLAPPALTVLAVEEPENHVAPQLLGRIMELLRAVSAAPPGQVVITSHSPGILSRVDPTEVRYLRLVADATTRKTEVREIVLPARADEAFKYIKEAVRAYPELYFSQLVILGEGDSEELVIPRILRAVGVGLDAKSISVVPLGGRHVNHLWRLLAGLSIPHVTLLDLDLERDGGGWGRIRTTCKELLAIGVPRSPLLDVEDGTLTDDQLKVLSGELKDLPPWLEELERHNVFFSRPLDLDLLMLEAFPTVYQSLAARGPQLPAAGTPEYEKRLTSAAHRVLGDEGGDGSAYSAKRRALFPWYTYLFLDGGKPSTHVLALSKLSDEDIEAALPQVLRRFRERAVSVISQP